MEKKCGNRLRSQLIKNESRVRAETDVYLNYYIVLLPTLREQMIMRSVLIENKSFTEIGKEHDLSRERIRQIVVRCMRKLEQIEKKKGILNGGFDSYIERIRSELEDKYNKKILALNKLTADKERALSRNYVDLKTIQVENLNLSNRSKNCLLSRGIKNFAGILNLTKKELRRTANLGAKSYIEIVSLVEDYGFDFKKEAYEREEEYKDYE